MLTCHSGAVVWDVERVDDPPVLEHDGAVQLWEVARERSSLGSLPVPTTENLGRPRCRIRTVERGESSLHTQTAAMRCRSISVRDGWMSPHGYRPDDDRGPRSHRWVSVVRRDSTPRGAWGPGSVTRVRGRSRPIALVPQEPIDSVEIGVHLPRMIRVGTWGAVRVHVGQHQVGHVVEIEIEVEVVVIHGCLDASKPAPVPFARPAKSA